jgi:hypothetical protein
VCAKLADLRKNLELAMRRYRVEVETTNVATLSVDPVEFRIAQEKKREIERAYREAFHAFVQHCEQHQCETNRTLKREVGDARSYKDKSA